MEGSRAPRSCSAGRAPDELEQVTLLEEDAAANRTPGGGQIPLCASCAGIYRARCGAVACTMCHGRLGYCPSLSDDRVDIQGLCAPCAVRTVRDHADAAAAEAEKVAQLTLRDLQQRLDAVPPAPVARPATVTTKGADGRSPAADRTGAKLGTFGSL